MQKEAAEQALCGLWMGSQLPGISKRVRFCNLLKGQKAQVTQATHVLIGRTLERALMVKKKNLPAMQETWVQSLGLEDPLEKGMGTHSSVLAWRIPWTEEPEGLQSTGLPMVRHD